MKLYYYCSSQSCKKTNSINVKSNNRYNLKQEIGEEMIDRCKHCGNDTKRHINRLHAEPNYFIVIGGIGVAILITFLLWDFGLISTLTGTLPIAIWANENKKASTFNRMLI